MYLLCTAEASARFFEHEVPFEPTEDDPWGADVEFDARPADWKITKIYLNEQFYRKGIRVGDQLIKVQGMELNERTKLQIKNILESGEACRISFRREIVLLREESIDAER